MANELKLCICGKTPRIERKKGMAGITKVPFYREQIVCRCGVSSKLFKAPDKAVEAWNTRPATPVEGVETVGYAYMNSDGELEYAHATSSEARNTPLVTRSQAEAIIAAERSMRKTAEQRLAQSQDDLKQARADNAALTAKLETANALVTCCCGSPVDTHGMGDGHSPVDQYHYALMQLEEQNAALTARIKELETERTMIVSHATMGGSNGIGLSVNEISVCVTALRNKLYDEGKKRAEALESQLTSQAAQYKDLEDYAREATKAITGLTGGGSENFSKQIGELFTADLPLCLERIRERYVSKVEVKRLEKKLATAKKALEPFDDHAKERAVDASEWCDTDTVKIVVTIGDLRKARAVLGGKPS